MKNIKKPAESEIDLAAIIATWPARLKVLKETNNISQNDAAEAAGLSSGQLSHYLQGLNTPSVTKFQDFENYLRRMGV